MRLDPNTTMVCPGVPLAGSIELSTGPVPAAGAEAVVVVVETAGGVVVVTEAAPDAVPPAPTPSFPACAVGGASGVVWGDVVGGRPDEDRDPPPLSLTAHVPSSAATIAIRLTPTISLELLR